MTGPGGNLSFQIYLDSSRTQVWGSINTAAFPVPAQADFRIRRFRSESGTIPGYLRLFGNQPAVTAGTYNTLFSSPQVRITGELTSSGSGSCTNTGNEDAGNFDPLSISATVAPACTVTATDLDFGTINGFLTSNNDSTSTLQVTCVNGTAYKVGLDNGLHYASGSRRMQGTGGQIAYSLYRNSTRTQTWGSTLGVDTVSGTGSGSAQSISVYGRVPPQTTPPAGAYQDTVTVSVTY
jgi:spore coat protein U-like protein